MPRPPRCRWIRFLPPARRFGPYEVPPAGEVVLPLEGMEALRLADLEGLEQQKAAEMMGVSRQTFGRILAQARATVARALAEGLVLVVEGGAYRLAPPHGPRRWRHRGGRGRW